MENELLPNVRGTVQTLRTLWSEKVQDEQNSVKKNLVNSRLGFQPSQKKLIKNNVPIPINTEVIKNDEQLTTIIDTNKSFKFEPTEQSSFMHDTDESLLFPAPPPSVIFQNQVQSITTVQQSVMKMFDIDKNKINGYYVKNSDIQHWHLVRHVFKSGLIFSSSRRASDSIIPLLMQTRIAKCRQRTESVDSTETQTPFETLIDYISYNDDKHTNLLDKKSMIKRIVSDTSACVQRNKLNDTIAQYETLIHHLRNYDKFTATYPMQSSPSSSSDRESKDSKEIIRNNKEYFEKNLMNKSSTGSSQTQSLTRNAGRTFTEFLLNDLLSSHKHNSSQIVQYLPKTVQTASQTESTELIETISTDETNKVIEEFNNVLNDNDNELELTPNSEINVIILNCITSSESTMMTSIDKPLIQRLFEGNKTAYTPENIDMKSYRIPEELMKTYESAKAKCFLSSETLLYATKIIKIDRRGYKEHIRILCITTERIYIITKKHPYPKEHILLKDILGIYCTPYKDGFICLKTREIRDDRGDWLFLVDHPCEVITQIFMAKEKTNNDDNYLKFEVKFNHIRRSAGTFSDEGRIEVRLSTKFYIKYEHYEMLAIYTS